MNVPELNTLYIYKSPRAFEELSVRAYNNYKYQDGAIIQQADVFRYAKTINNVTVLLICKEKNIKKIDNFIDSKTYDQEYTGGLPIKTEYKYV